MLTIIMVRADSYSVDSVVQKNVNAAGEIHWVSVVQFLLYHWLQQEWRVIYKASMVLTLMILQQLKNYAYMWHSIKMFMKQPDIEFSISITLNQNLEHTIWSCCSAKPYSLLNIPSSSGTCECLFSNSLVSNRMSSLEYKTTYWWPFLFAMAQ